MDKLKKLFDPIRIKETELKNRIVYPPIASSYANEFGYVTKTMKSFYAERAKGGVGLIIIECAAVEPLGNTRYDTLQISDDSYTNGHQELAECIKRHGAKACLQLFHGGKLGRAAVLRQMPVSASPIPSETLWAVPEPVRELSIDELKKLKKKYADAARRAIEAGYDMVEIHAAHGALLAQFLSPLTNKRSDIYGGDQKKRCRYPIEIINVVREVVGEDFPISLRISGEEYVEGGLTIEHTKVIAKMMEEYIDALDIGGGSVGTMGGYIPITPNQRFPEGCFLPAAAELKNVVKIPVIITGRIIDPEFADRIIMEGKTDMVAMGRALICDPYLPQKAMEGRFEDIQTCIGCNIGCVGAQARMEPLSCIQNPRAGKEDLYKIERAKHPKKVLVVGGGPAGMTAARIAALRAHDVTLYEKSNRLGEGLQLSALAPHKDGYNKITEYHSRQFKKLGVKIELGKEVTLELVEDEKADVIILATGAVPIIPDIPGVHGENVGLARDFLQGKREVKRKAVIIGGGSVGAETAELLAEKGKEVAIVEQLGNVCRDMVASNKSFLLRSLDKLGVMVLTNIMVERITDSGIVFSKYGERGTIEADTVIIAVGYQPNMDLVTLLKDKPNIYLIGDCLRPAQVLEAVRDAWAVGLRI